MQKKKKKPVRENRNTARSQVTETLQQAREKPDSLLTPQYPTLRIMRIY